jgi:GTPase SAR1 family protein
VQSFLNHNIDLKSSDTIPTIGIRDVRTHYNKYKRDVMFTFYNAINSLQETAWNLCFNESLDTFITFYSWIPSFSENINNIFFSFDRNASKNMARLYCDSSDIYIENNGEKINSFTDKDVGTIVFKGNVDNLFITNSE